MRNLLQPVYDLSTRLARVALGLGLLIALVSAIVGAVSLFGLLEAAPTAPPASLGRWWLQTLTATLTYYLFTSLSATVVGAVIGALTAKRGLRVLRPKWHNGAVRRGLELTGALPNVALAAIWLASHPGQSLPALMTVTLVQQSFEVGTRVKAMIEAPRRSPVELRYELKKSASQCALTLASGEMALIALGLAPPNYATWPSSAASYLCAYSPGTSVALFVLALAGTLILPVCIFLAGPARPAGH